MSGWIEFLIRASVLLFLGLWALSTLAVKVASLRLLVWYKDLPAADRPPVYIEAPMVTLRQYRRLMAEQAGHA